MSPPKPAADANAAMEGSTIVILSSSLYEEQLPQELIWKKKNASPGEHPIPWPIHRHPTKRAAKEK